ncbi:hypothetical protein IGI37_002490 [Enterococcus sp. AZ194]|uniref:hypothetical protein n=1 Tax=Enterococcus sp. AZ194 TaxID=2774629 RepID=UPI003F28E7C7
MLEAVKKIQSAETENEELKEALIHKLRQEQEQKENELRAIKVRTQNVTIEEVHALEENLTKSLQQEQAELQQVSEKTRATYQQLYNEKKATAVKTIIERVKQTYGRL